MLRIVPAVGHEATALSLSLSCRLQRVWNASTAFKFGEILGKIKVNIRRIGRA